MNEAGVSAGDSAVKATQAHGLKTHGLHDVGVQPGRRDERVGLAAGRCTRLRSHPPAVLVPVSARVAGSSASPGGGAAVRARLSRRSTHTANRLSR